MRHRLPLIAACILAALTTSKAQTKFDESGLWDNWYVGVNTGFNSKLTHNSFMSHLNPHATIRVGRNIIPIVGVMVEATPFFNDQKFPYARVGNIDLFSKTAVKALNLHLLGNLNLNNLFKGYEGEPRFFEAHFIAGIGLNHVFGISNATKNDFVSKIGFDLSLMLGPDKEWEAYIEPALNYNLTRYSNRVEYNPNYAAWQLAVGVNYHLNKVRWSRRVRHASAYSAFNGSTRGFDAEATAKPRAKEKRYEDTTPVIFDQTEVTTDKQKPARKNSDKEQPVRPTTAQPEEPTTPTSVSPAQAVTPATVQIETVTPVAKQPVSVQVVPVTTVTPTVPEDSHVEATGNKETAKAGKTTAKGTKSAKATVPDVSPVETPAKATTAAKPSKASKSATASVASASSALPPIHFKAGENSIPDDQYEALSKVATHLKSHPRAQLVIKGPRARAEAVRNALMRRFTISASRLSCVSGTGDTVTFSEK